MPDDASSMPDPARRSRVVHDTTTSPAPAAASTRAAACTATPRASPPTMCTSPVWHPTRICRPAAADACAMARPQRYYYKHTTEALGKPQGLGADLSSSRGMVAAA